MADRDSVLSDFARAASEALRRDRNINENAPAEEVCLRFLIHAPRQPAFSFGYGMTSGFARGLSAAYQAAGVPIRSEITTALFMVSELLKSSHDLTPDLARQVNDACLMLNSMEKARGSAKAEVDEFEAALG